jgi:hypothetical protein
MVAVQMTYHHRVNMGERRVRLGKYAQKSRLGKPPGV